MALADARLSSNVSPDAVDRLTSALAARLDEIVDAIAAAYREHIPSYSAAPPEVFDEVRMLTTANVRVCIGVLKGEVDLASLNPIQAELARTRATQGFPLHEVLLTYQLGSRVFYDELLREIAPLHPQEWTEVVPYVTRVMLDLVRNATEIVSRTYLEVEDARIAQDEHDFQVLTEILAGLRERDQTYLDRANRRGITFDDVAWCAVTRASEGELSGTIQALRRALRQTVVGRVGRCIVAFGGGDAPEHLPVETPTGTARYEGPESFRRAQAAYEVASHLGKKAVRYEAVMPLAMVFEGPDHQREAFVRTQLGPVIDDPIGEDLLTSLKAYYANGQSVAAAARELHVHRHTLEYRLERVARLLDADLREASRRLFLELALALRTSTS